MISSKKNKFTQDLRVLVTDNLIFFNFLIIYIYIYYIKNVPMFYILNLNPNFNLKYHILKTKPQFSIYSKVFNQLFHK